MKLSVPDFKLNWNRAPKN